MPLRTARYLVFVAALVGCADGVAPTAATDAPNMNRSTPGQTPTETGLKLRQFMNAGNRNLEASGSNMRISKIEWLPTSAAEQSNAATIYFQQVGNQFWDGNFVYGDTRRSSWSYPLTAPGALVYSIDISPDGTPPFGGMTGQQSAAAIERAMRTWDAQDCTSLTLTPETGVTAEMDLGVFAYLVTNGLYGSPWHAGDVQHAGFGSLWAFGAYAFTVEFTFADENGPTDIDRNGRADVAFREIYYAPFVPWVDDVNADPTVAADLESVALHEAGHALSQFHFGTVFLRTDGTPFTNPRAVMNPINLGALRTLQRSDIGGHCGIWANW